jgi:hypothetical protein
MEVLQEALRALFDGKAGRIWELACESQFTSRVVQSAINIVKTKLDSHETWLAGWLGAQALLADLKGKVLEAVSHGNANYVINALLDSMPTELLGFVFEELAGRECWAANHKIGCRAVMRLLRHCEANESAEARIAVVLAHASETLGHAMLGLAHKSNVQYGKILLGEIFGRGRPNQRDAVATALCGKVVLNAMDRYGSRIVEMVFDQCRSGDIESSPSISHCVTEFGTELAENSSIRQNMCRSPWGRHVLKKFEAIRNELASTTRF